MKISKRYFSAFIMLLAIEIVIALYVRDTIIRPLVGDILVVVLMYAFARVFIQNTPRLMPLYLVLLAAAVEMAQYFHAVELLGLQNNRLLSTIIGTTFDIRDVFCYMIGGVILLIFESVVRKVKS